MSREEEHVGDLKAFEAELASLAPRTDRLDRERLMFLAGQASVAAGTARPTAQVKRWAWPAAFAAMTTVAATLTLMLVLRPEPQVVVRIVERPIEPPDGSARVATREAEPPSTADEGVESLPVPDETMPGPPGRSSLLASVGLGWLERPSEKRVGIPAPYPRLLQQVLREGPDSWAPPAGMQDAGRAAPPVPYRELLNSLLENQSPDRPLPDWPARKTFLFPGANS